MNMGVVVRMFPINSLFSRNFSRMDEAQTIYWKHILGNYLTRGSETDIFKKLGN